MTDDDLRLLFFFFLQLFTWHREYVQISNMSVVFKKICISEKLLLTSIHTYTCMHVYMYTHTDIQ